MEEGGSETGNTREEEVVVGMGVGGTKVGGVNTVSALEREREQ
ncbi:MAG: hypothetical protein AAGM46_26095 [Cyanobacteria bacterium J06582_2]